MTARRSIDWPPVIDQAREIVLSYDTGVTLRQLFYRLVAAELIPNTTSAYKRLSALTAEGRREDRFPDLLDLTREIRRPSSWTSPREALTALVAAYRRDRTERQEWSIYLGVEKHGLVTQLDRWFRDLGVPILALGGYASQTLADAVSRDVAERERPAVLLYAGDFDPSGLDIIRDLEERADGFAEVHRIALTWEQVEEHDLPPQMGKASDPRAAAFVERHGQLVQVELDALPPDDLRALYQGAISDYMDKSMYEAVLRREEAERDVLRRTLA